MKVLAETRKKLKWTTFQFRFATGKLKGKKYNEFAFSVAKVCGKTVIKLGAKTKLQNSLLYFSDLWELGNVWGVFVISISRSFDRYVWILREQFLVGISLALADNTYFSLVKQFIEIGSLD